jgi:alpha-glucosidase
MLVGGQTPFFDQDGVHEIYREWRSIMDGYAPERIAVAEAWLPSLERTARYVRPGELHQAFNFEFLGADWSGPTYRDVIDASLRVMGSVGAPSTWVMSNHDVVRHASRLAAGVGGVAGGAGAPDGVRSQADPALGVRRARAAALVMLALPGSVYLYQGEELGLPEVFDLPPQARQDPLFARTAGAELGRDGCRVPLPWSGTTPPYGFGSRGSWLPQPASWARLSVAVQQADASSTLSLYTRALRLRRELPALGAGDLRWLSQPDDDVLVFERPGRDGDPTVICAVNQGAKAAYIRDGQPIIASAPLTGDGHLRPDTAAWWSTPGAPI